MNMYLNYGYIHDCLVLCVKTKLAQNTVGLDSHTGQYQPFMNILYVDMMDKMQFAN